MSFGQVPPATVYLHFVSNHDRHDSFWKWSIFGPLADPPSKQHIVSPRELTLINIIKFCIVLNYNNHTKSDRATYEECVICRSIMHVITCTLWQQWSSTLIVLFLESCSRVLIPTLPSPWEAPLIASPRLDKSNQGIRVIVFVLSINLIDWNQSVHLTIIIMIHAPGQGIRRTGWSWEQFQDWQWSCCGWWHDPSPYRSASGLSPPAVSDYISQRVECIKIQVEEVAFFQSQS